MKRRSPRAERVSETWRRRARARRGDDCDCAPRTRPFDARRVPTRSTKADALECAGKRTGARSRHRRATTMHVARPAPATTTATCATRVSSSCACARARAARVGRRDGRLEVGGGARRRRDARARATVVPEDGTARASVDEWLARYADDATPPAGVFATYDDAGTVTYIDFAKNVAQALRSTRARAGDDRARTARVMAFRNSAMATREVLAAEARRWREALRNGETPALNAEWDAEDARDAAGSASTVKAVVGDEAAKSVMVSPFAAEAAAAAAEKADAGAESLDEKGADEPLLELTPENVDKALDEVRPYLIADGGNVELVKIENGIVAVRLNGACGTCASSSATMKGGIEKLLKQKFGSAVDEVVNVGEDLPEMSVETIEEYLGKLRNSITQHGGEVSVESLERGVCVLKFKGPQALAFSIAQALKTKFPFVRECKIRQIK